MTHEYKHEGVNFFAWTVSECIFCVVNGQGINHVNEAMNLFPMFLIPK